jgi:hypothetical protein
MFELSQETSKILDSVRNEYTERTGREVTPEEMIDALIKLGHYNLIGMWL